MKNISNNYPEWNEPGTEPDQTKKDNGWQPGEKPPADWWNWKYNKGYQSFQDIDEGIAKRLSDVLTEGILTGGEVTENTTADLNILVEPLTGFNTNGARINLGSQRAVDLSTYLPTTVGNEKYVSVYVDVVGLETNTEINIVEGSPAPAGSATKPIIDNMQGVLLADVLLEEGQTTILNVDIEELRKQKIYLNNIAGQTDYINVKDFGAVGNNAEKDTQAFIDAVNYAEEGQSIYFPGDNTFLINQTVNINKSLNLFGEGTLKNVNENEGSLIFDMSGNEETGIEVTSDILQGDTVINLTDVSSLNIGDYIRLKTDELYMDIGTRNYTKGEIIKIKSIDNTNNNITIRENGVELSYSSNNSLYAHKLNYIENVNIEGVTFDGLGEDFLQSGVVFKLIKNLKINNINFKNNFRSGLTLRSCYNASISNSYFYNIHEYGLGYPLHASNACKNINIINNIFEKVRHGFDTIGIEGVPMFINVIGNNVSNSDFVGGLSCHGNARYILFDSNTIENTKSGIIIRSPHCTVKNNNIINCNGAGIEVTEAGSYNLKINNNKIHNCSVTEKSAINIENTFNTYPSKDNYSVDISNNTITSDFTLQKGIYFNSRARFINIDNNQIGKYKYYGIDIRRVYNVKCSNNTFLDGTISGSTAISLSLGDKSNYDIPNTAKNTAIVTNNFMQKIYDGILIDLYGTSNIGTTILSNNALIDTSGTDYNISSDVIKNSNNVPDYA